MKSLIKYSLFLFLYGLILTSCLDNNNIPTDFTEELEFNALILRETESRGNYLNTIEFPAFVNPENISNEIENYNIIDVRTEEHFRKGFINNSVNVNNNELFNYVINLDSDKPILLVSISGQASAYYTALFRIYGLKNIYSLKFGIAGWNEKFESEILSHCGSRSPQVPSITIKEKFFNLPSIENQNESLSIQELFDERIKNLIHDGFNEELTSDLLEDSQNDINSCNFGYLKTVGNIYLMASTATDLKYDIPQAGKTEIFHPFWGINDFSSTVKLQTIPPNKLIACYSYSGQLSAATVAYLRLLGYNAKSVLFGVQYYAYYSAKNTLGTGRLYTFNQSNNFPISVR